MFTGIIEDTGIITGLESKGSNRTIWIKSRISPELKVDQSVSHSGVCLTVEEVTGDIHRVTAIEETISKTTAGNWKTGDLVNLERCLVMNGRLDGHIVQGHVDCTGVCINRMEKDGSWEFEFEFPEKFGYLIIEKGSISLNGISLTIYNIGQNKFSIGVIPFTFEHTDMEQLQIGNKVNIEFDMVGKYLKRFTDLKIG